MSGGFVKWTEDMDRYLEEIARNKHSFSYAAEAISKKYNVVVSRSSIAGRAKRKKIDFSVDRQKRVGRPAKKETVIVDRHPRFKNPNARSLKFYELLSKHCRFPVGDTRDDTLRFCGADLRLGTSTPYCEYCCPLVFIRDSSINKKGKR